MRWPTSFCPGAWGFSNCATAATRRRRCRLEAERLEPREVPAITDPSLVVPVTPLPRQPVGVAFVDPDFNTVLRRVSDASETPGAFETQIYSQLQAFSSDNEYLLLNRSGEFIVRRVDDLSLVPLDTSLWNVPRWHPTRPHTLVHFDTNDISFNNTVTLQFTDVDTRVTTDIFTLPAEYQTIRGNQSFDEIEVAGDGSIWLSGMVQTADRRQAIFTLDIENRQLGVLRPLDDFYTVGSDIYGPGRAGQPDPQFGNMEPDWIGVSALGRYLVLGWQRDGDSETRGAETFDIRTGAFAGRVSDSRQHGDLGVMPDGTSEFFMTFSFPSPIDPNLPVNVYRTLPGSDPIAAPNYLQTVVWGNQDHVSARGPNGLAVITSGTDPSNGFTQFEAEIWVQYIDGRVLRLAHHRSTSAGYWVQPRASISRDGRYVVFASDWGVQTGTNDDARGDPYIIDLQGDPTPGDNQAPVLADLSNRSVVQGQQLTFTATASDPDNNPLTFSLEAGAPAGATINAMNGVFTWTPTTAQGPGSFDITVRVTDNGNPALSDSQTIQVTVVDPAANQAPVLAAIGNQTVNEGSLLTFTATATDPDGNPLSFSLKFYHK